MLLLAPEHLVAPLSSFVATQVPAQQTLGRVWNANLCSLSKCCGLKQVKNNEKQSPKFLGDRTMSLCNSPAWEGGAAGSAVEGSGCL